MSVSQIFPTKGAKIFRTYFLWGALGGILGLLYLLAIPSDPKNAFFAGLSLSRLVLISVFLVGIVGFGGLFLKARDQNWFINRETFVAGLNQHRFALAYVTAGAFMGMSLGIFWLLVTLASGKLLIYASLVRLVPLVGWLTLLCGQTLFAVYHLSVHPREVFRKGFTFAALGLLLGMLLLIFLGTKLDAGFYLEITKEDHLVEWLTVLFLLLAFLWSLALIRKIGRRPYAWFYLAFALFCIFASLEEISWAQRIFNVQSSQFFMENSDQLETNAHNVFQKWTGLRTTQIAALALGFYGVVLPWLVLLAPVKGWVTKFRVPVPPTLLSVNFLISVSMLSRRLSGREEEVGEMLLAFCLFLFMAFEGMKE